MWRINYYGCTVGFVRHVMTSTYTISAVSWEWGGGCDVSLNGVETHFRPLIGGIPSKYYWLWRSV